jgi:hypothetical protein
MFFISVCFASSSYSSFVAHWYAAWGGSEKNLSQYTAAIAMVIPPRDSVFFRWYRFPPPSNHQTIRNVKPSPLPIARHTREIASTNVATTAAAAFDGAARSQFEARHPNANVATEAVL